MCSPAPREHLQRVLLDKHLPFRRIAASLDWHPQQGTGKPAGAVRKSAAALVLAVLTVAAFFPVLGANFVNLDDPKYVTANPHVQRGWSFESLRWACTSFDAANWHPLTWASHLTDVTLFGLRSGAHHGTSLALHVLAAVLLLFVLEGMTGRLGPSLVAAGLFAVHPLRVESVAWIAERKDVLSVLLAMATLLLYLRHARHPGAGRFVPVVVVFSCGLMSKPMLVTLPFLLLLLDWWPLGRFHRPAAGGGPSPAAPGSRVVLEKTPLLALSAISCLVTSLAQSRGGAMIPLDLIPLQARVLNAASSYAGYLGKTIWPVGLIPLYPHRASDLSAAAFAAALALLTVISAIAWSLRQRRPWLLGGWLWYLGALVPVIGFVQVGLQAMADRYTYLPSIGLAVALSWGAFPGRLLPRRGGAVRGAAAAAVLLLLALFTARQSGSWGDTVTLFTRATAVDPGNYLAFNQLGAAALARGETERAIALLSRAFELRPEFLVTRYNLGLALLDAGRREEALPHLTAYLDARPQDAEARLARGKLYVEPARHEEALRDFETALAANPDDPQAHYLRGYVLSKLGRTAEAAAAYRSAAVLDPLDAAIRFNLGQELRRLGKPQEALLEYEAAARLDPLDAEARNALGAMLAEQGQLGRALQHLEEAVRLAPDFVAARVNLGRVRGLIDGPQRR